MCKWCCRTLHATRDDIDGLTRCDEILLRAPDRSVRFRQSLPTLRTLLARPRRGDDVPFERGRDSAVLGRTLKHLQDGILGREGGRVGRGLERGDYGGKDADAGVVRRDGRVAPGDLR